MIPHPKLGDALARDVYLRQRLHPRRRDQDYLHFADLLQYLRAQAPRASGRLFDFGCGGAPYRELFAHCDAYVGADIQPGPAVEIVLREDFSTGQSDASYDTVLSTQVLEHVANPRAYVIEAARILRPGGQLILTTHGMGEEHGCPWDFHRWTGNGLEQLIRQCGLEVVEGAKLTCGIRGALLLFNQSMPHFRAPGGGGWRLPLAALRKFHRRIGAPVFNWLADRFPLLAVVPSSSTENLYAGVAVRARKP